MSDIRYALCLLLEYFSLASLSLSLFVYEYVRMCTRTYTHECVRACIRTNVHENVYARMCTSTYTHESVRVHVCTNSVCRVSLLRRAIEFEMIIFVSLVITVVSQFFIELIPIIRVIIMRMSS